MARHIQVAVYLVVGLMVNACYGVDISGGEGLRADASATCVVEDRRLGREIDGEVVVSLASRDVTSGFPAFTFTLSTEGNYRLVGHGLLPSREGRVPPRIVQKLLQDAETFRFLTFADEMLIPLNPVPVLDLTIVVDGAAKQVRFSPVMDDRAMSMALERGAVFAFQISVAHLLAQRVMDLLGDLR